MIRFVSISAVVVLAFAGAAQAQFRHPPPHAYDLSASLRLDVEPEETQVFVDGYWAGTVDDFDGLFQRLHLEPGEHAIELYLQGHRTFRQKIYLQPHGTFHIRHQMQPLGPGEAPDPRPVPRERPERPGRYDRPERSGRPAQSERESFGTLALRVQPADAEIFVDGERWEHPGGDVRLEIELPAGDHRIAIRREGFATYERTVRVRPGDTTAINVSLGKP